MQRRSGDTIYRVPTCRFNSIGVRLAKRTSLTVWSGHSTACTRGCKPPTAILQDAKRRFGAWSIPNVMGIFIWDFEGRFLEANDEFLRMVGYDREDLLAGSIRWTDLTPPDWRDRSNARMERGKSSGRFEPFEKEYTRKNGSRVPVLIGGATLNRAATKALHSWSI